MIESSLKNNISPMCPRYVVREPTYSTLQNPSIVRKSDDRHKLLYFSESTNRTNEPTIVPVLRTGREQNRTYRKSVNE
jgi:hypothetical protein